MPKRENRLTHRFVQTTAKPGRYPDGRGLYLEVDRKGHGSKSWIFLYQKNNRPRAMGLGPVHCVSLSEARTRARKARQLLADGFDPLELKRNEKTREALRSAKAVSFADAAERYIATVEGSWKDARSAAAWRGSLKTHAFPILGALPVAAIDTDLVVKTLSAIWSAKPLEAAKVRLRIERILDWARVQGLREGENPARWRGHLSHLFPPVRRVKPQQHFAALPVAEIPSLMQRLRDQDGIAARALEFCILTTARQATVRAMCWGEIDLATAMWIAPPAHVKGHKDKPREWRSPLSQRALDILRKIKGTSDPDPQAKVFAMPINAMHETLRSLHPTATVHGTARSTLKDWSRKRGFGDELSELQLGHVVGSATKRSYARDDLLEERRPLVEAWSAYCGTNPERQDNVVPLVSGAAHG